MNELVEFDKNRMETAVRLYNYMKNESSPYKAVREKRAMQLKQNYIKALLSLRTTYKLGLDKLDI